MMRMTFQIGDRTVYWDFDDEQGVVILQSIIQAVGPAHGEVEND